MLANPDTVLDLKRKAVEARKLILKSVHTAGAGHVGGPLSATDILVTLYFDVLRDRSGSTRLGGPRPLHPVEGPLEHRALRRPRAARLLPGRGAVDLRRDRLAAPGPPRT